MNATAEQVTQQAEQLTAKMDDLKKQVRGGKGAAAAYGRAGGLCLHLETEQDVC
jgi:hypothetical protein